jgi:hypothetical protein
LLLELMLDVNEYYISSNNRLHNTRKKQEADQDSAQADIILMKCKNQDFITSTKT